MHVHFTHIKNSVTATLGDLLLAKAESCADSVVKANRVQGRAATTVYKDSVATNGPFGKSICYLSVGL